MQLAAPGWDDGQAQAGRCYVSLAVTHTTLHNSHFRPRAPLPPSAGPREAMLPAIPLKRGSPSSQHLSKGSLMASTDDSQPFLMLCQQCGQGPMFKENF